jgi:hypothetical protein
MIPQAVEPGTPGFFYPRFLSSGAMKPIGLRLAGGGGAISWRMVFMRPAID